MKTIQRLLLALAVAFWAALTSAQSPNSEGPIFDVRTFGARGDGKTLDTAAISKPRIEVAPRGAESDRRSHPSSALPAVPFGGLQPTPAAHSKIRYPCPRGNHKVGLKACRPA